MDIVLWKLGITGEALHLLYVVQTMIQMHAMIKLIVAMDIRTEICSDRNQTRDGAIVEENHKQIIRIKSVCVENFEFIAPRLLIISIFVFFIFLSISRSTIFFSSRTYHLKISLMF